MNHSETGKFIVLEGIDGSGTTSQASLLAEHLEASGRAVVVTREPSTGPVGAMIRQILTHRLVVPSDQGYSAPHWATMALLFAADRLDHNEATILPALRAGKVVVSDRYTLSSLAYQSLTSEEGARQLPWLREINSRALVPDLTVILDVPADIAADRRASRGEPKELFEVDELQRALASAYQRAETLLPAIHRVVHVNAGRDLTVVQRDVVSAVESVLGLRAASTGRQLAP